MKLIPVFFALFFYPFYSWSAKPGDTAPDCLLPFLAEENQSVSLYQFKGKVLFLDFWASWCPPCEKSFPFLDQLYQQYHSQGLEIIAVNLDEEKKDALKFVNDHPVKFSIVHDSEGDCPEKYQARAMPSSYIIDKSGTIRHVNYGFLSSEESELSRQVASLLDE